MSAAPYVPLRLFSCYTMLEGAMEPKAIAAQCRRLDFPAAALTDRTRVVFFETPANPNMRLIDIAEISSIAKAAGARVITLPRVFEPELGREHVERLSVELERKL